MPFISFPSFSLPVQSLREIQLQELSSTFYARTFKQITQSLSAVASIISTLFQKIIENLSEAVDKTYTLLFKMIGHDREYARKYGHGIYNGYNSCYINAVVQALRFVQTDLFDTNENISTSATLHRQKLKTLFATINPHLNALPLDASPVDTRHSDTRLVTTRPVSAHEISAYRKFMISSGFPARSEFAQDDSALFCMFLLEKLEVRTLPLKLDIKHLLQLNIPAFSKDQPFPAYLPLGLGEDTSTSSISELVATREFLERVDVTKLRANTSVNQDERSQKLLKDLPDFLDLPTSQQIVLKNNFLPKTLPIFLKRTLYDLQTRAPKKNKRAVLPSLTLEIPIENTNLQAKYTLSSVVVHKGQATRGHYTTFIPKFEDSSLWIEYDDSFVMCVDQKKNPERYARLTHFIAQNGYLYFYTLAHTVKST